MHRFLAILTLCVALLALLSPSFAAGVCIANSGLPTLSASHDGGPAHLPNPCEMQGGKRVMPTQPDLTRRVVEVPRATVAQWARGLADQPMRQGRAPIAELPRPGWAEPHRHRHRLPQRGPSRPPYETFEMTDLIIGRRALLAGAASFAALALAGCATSGAPRLETETVRIPDDVLAMYAARPEERFPIPAARMDLIEPQFWRQVVDDPTGERPGTVVVDTAHRFLYLVQENGKAMRYGVGIGRDGFTWSGRGTIQYKREWPTWTPPSEMIDRQPELEPYRRGMAPSLENPLGARALYIFKDGRDTIYRLHGATDERTIGKAISSGCVRLLNQDVIDLYQRVPSGSPILVM